MPIYEYLCQKCGTFEFTQRITDKALGKCPTCKGRVKKLISNTSFHLKGTGWYITDYARKGQNGSDSKSATESKSEPKKSESSTSGGEKSSSTSSTAAAS